VKTPAPSISGQISFRLPPDNGTNNRHRRNHEGDRHRRFVHAKSHKDESKADRRKDNDRAACNFDLNIKIQPASAYPLADFDHAAEPPKSLQTPNPGKSFHMAEVSGIT
jgi:hypothetical protein